MGYPAFCPGVPERKKKEKKRKEKKESYGTCTQKQLS